METIYNIPDLIELIERRNLNSKQICDVLERGFKLFGDEGKKPGQLKNELKTYWNKYGDNSDKPFLINNEMNVEGYLNKYDNSNRLWRHFTTAKAACLASLHYKDGIVGSDENNICYYLGEPTQLNIPPE